MDKDQEIKLLREALEEIIPLTEWVAMHADNGQYKGWCATDVAKAALSGKKLTASEWKPGIGPAMGGKT